jgi:hypothetical protein
VQWRKMAIASIVNKIIIRSGLERNEKRQLIRLTYGLVGMSEMKTRGFNPEKLNNRSKRSESTNFTGVLPPKSYLMPKGHYKNICPMNAKQGYKMIDEICENNNIFKKRSKVLKK